MSFRLNPFKVMRAVGIVAIVAYGAVLVIGYKKSKVNTTESITKDMKVRNKDFYNSKDYKNYMNNKKYQDLLNVKEKFIKLNLFDKAFTLKSFLDLFNKKTIADFSKVGLTKFFGKIHGISSNVLSKNELYLLEESVTGLFTKKIKL